MKMCQLKPGPAPPKTKKHPGGSCSLHWNPKGTRPSSRNGEFFLAVIPKQLSHLSRVCFLTKIKLLLESLTGCRDIFQTQATPGVRNAVVRDHWVSKTEQVPGWLTKAEPSERAGGYCPQTLGSVIVSSLLLGLSCKENVRPVLTGYLQRGMFCYRPVHVYPRSHMEAPRASVAGRCVLFGLQSSLSLN